MLGTGSDPASEASEASDDHFCLRTCYVANRSVAERLQIVVSQAVLFTVSMEGSAYALEDFAVSELVLVRNVNRKEPWWPVG